MSSRSFFRLLITQIFTACCLLLLFSGSPAVANTTQPFTPSCMTPEKDKKVKKRKNKCGANSCPAWRRSHGKKAGSQLNINASIGLVPTFFMDGAKQESPPLQVELSYRVNTLFSIGAIYGHSVSRSRPKIVSDGVLITWKNEQILASVRPTLHISKIPKWDFYGGSSLGFRRTKMTGQTDGNPAVLEKEARHQGIKPVKDVPDLSAFLGARYSVSTKWQVGGEIGFGVSLVTVGVNYLILGKTNAKSSGK